MVYIARLFAVVFSLLMVLAAMPMPAHAAGLTESQIQAVTNLLASFNTDTSVVASVNATLRGQNPGLHNDDSPRTFASTPTTTKYKW
jgi:hypothetical protein